MKKLFAVLLSIVMVCSMAACGSAPKAAEGELQTVVPGVLTVATSPDFAPYEFYAIDENGTPVLAGFDMALAQYIADYLGLKLDVIPMEFKGVISEVAKGSVDIGMAGLSPDPDRVDQMDFSQIYYEGTQSLVCLKDNKDLCTSFEALNSPDVSIGAQIGSIQADLAAENTPDADVVLLSKVTDLVAELLSGKLDAAYIETAVAESYQKNYPELFLALEVPYDEAGNVVGVAKGNEALLTGVNEAIAKALEDGSFDRFIVEANEQASGEIIEGLVD